jgi:hypothetical protein
VYHYYKMTVTLPENIVLKVLVGSEPHLQLTQAIKLTYFILQHKDIARRFNLKAGEVAETFADLQDTSRSLFRIPALSQIEFKYQDDERDWIVMSSPTEFQEALRCMVAQQQRLLGVAKSSNKDVEEIAADAALLKLQMVVVPVKCRSVSTETGLIASVGTLQSIFSSSVAIGTSDHALPGNECFHISLMMTSPTNTRVKPNIVMKVTSGTSTSAVFTNTAQTSTEDQCCTSQSIQTNPILTVSTLSSTCAERCETSTGPMYMPSKASDTQTYPMITISSYVSTSEPAKEMAVGTDDDLNLLKVSCRCPMVLKASISTETDELHNETSTCTVSTYSSTNSFIQAESSTATHATMSTQTTADALTLVDAHLGTSDYSYMFPPKVTVTTYTSTRPLSLTTTASGTHDEEAKARRNHGVWTGAIDYEVEMGTMTMDCGKASTVSVGTEAGVGEDEFVLV